MTHKKLQRSDFTEVAIENFIAGSELAVDLFIQLSDAKFVQIARTGERVQMERLLQYESKKVTHLFIKNEEYSKYLHRGLAIAGIIVKNKELPLAQRQTSLTQIAANVYAEIEALGMNKDIFIHSQAVTGAAIALCQSKHDVFQMLEQFSQTANSTYAHSVAVSVISVMIGTALNWKGAAIEKLGLGGLLHDIGKRELSPALLVKTRALMTQKEVTEIESHSFRGMQLLRSLPDIPDDVISIAYEHHENSLGMGYPRNIKQIFINPLARVVSLANEFCNLTMKNPGVGVQKTPQEAVDHIEVVMGQPYWTDAFKALKVLIKENPKKKTA
jgi:putative nucleotidyltransferase with HDIG domain